jgi:quinolinate synthase
MAEMAKLLNPSKTVLIPDPVPAVRSRIDHATGCAAVAVKLSRRADVSGVNTSAAVKANPTSAALRAMPGDRRSLGVERVIMLPDEYLAKNIAAQTHVAAITDRHCEV